VLKEGDVKELGACKVKARMDGLMDGIEKGKRDETGRRVGMPG